MIGVGPATLSSLSAPVAPGACLSKSASIRFRMATEGFLAISVATFGMGLAYSFNGTTPAPVRGSVNEEKSA